MSGFPEPIAHLTCDNCGKQQNGPGIIGWLRLENHPYALDVRAAGDPRRLPTDFCGWTCVATWTERATRIVRTESPA